MTPDSPPFTVFATAAELGPLSTDNVDAIAFAPTPPVIPALSQWGLIGLGLLLLTAVFVTNRRRLHG